MAITEPDNKRQADATSSAARKPWWQRLAWLVLIWSASVLALAVVAGLLRLFMSAAGLGVP